MNFFNVQKEIVLDDKRYLEKLIERQATKKTETYEVIPQKKNDSSGKIVLKSLFTTTEIWNHFDVNIFYSTLNYKLHDSNNSIKIVISTKFRSWNIIFIMLLIWPIGVFLTGTTLQFGLTLLSFVGIKMITDWFLSRIEKNVIKSLKKRLEKLRKLHKVKPLFEN